MTGRYEIVEQIGRGATSVVHRGRDLRLGREVAIKVLRADHGHDPAFLGRFHRQAANAALLNHPAIVAVYDTGEFGPDDGVNGLDRIDGADGAPFIVMELVEGRTLRTELKGTDDGRLTPVRAVEIVADICAALDFSHRHGIVHRGICPENVMLTASGAVKVMDFGIPRPTVPDGGSGDAGSRPARAASYLSPEQTKGEPVDARSDVYGVGCLLYELLTGAPPFTGDDPVEIAYRQVRERPPPAGESVPEIPTELDAIVLKALEKEPVDRYQSAADLRSDLAEVLVGTHVAGSAASSVPVGTRPAAGSSPPLLAPPTRTRPAADGDPPPTPRPRRVASFLAFGLICVVTLAAAVWLTMSVITTPPPARPIAVPDLSGMTVDGARQALADKRLVVGTITEQDSTDQETGRVLLQRPSGRTEVAGGTPVNLVVGRGVRTVSVPDLVGLTPDQAKQALAPARLKYVEHQQPSSDADRGKVLAQAPTAHGQAPPNTTVIVTVGTGLTMVTVPDGIVGVSVEEATGILRDAGLTAVGVEQDGAQEAGVVMQADYPPGDRVPEGSPVTLNYSNNALMVMPNLVGRGLDSAAGLLQDRGWAGDADTIDTSSAPASTANLIGAVVTQQPTAGSLVRKLGTPVSVGIGVRQITMPALVGKTRSEAEAQLKAAGATTVTFADGGTGPRGQNNRVRSQSVPGGATIAADTPIVVVVYGG